MIGEDFNNIYIVLEPVESVELVNVLQQWHQTGPAFEDLLRRVELRSRIDGGLVGRDSAAAAASLKTLP